MFWGELQGKSVGQLDSWTVYFDQTKERTGDRAIFDGYENCKSGNMIIFVKR
jgi:hypothetical protein